MDGFNAGITGGALPFGWLTGGNDGGPLGRRLGSRSDSEPVVEPAGKIVADDPGGFWGEAPKPALG